MDIVVEQRKFTLRSEFDISTPLGNFRAEKQLLSLGDKIQLLAGNAVIARIKSRFFVFRPKYDFELSDGTVYRFRCTKAWKRVFACEGNGKCYWLYEHKGVRYSIFDGDRQIAAFTKNRIKIGKGDRYELRANSDANITVIICLVLTVDVTENEGDQESVTVDLGRIGPEERKFDESWEPD
jgi:uncharacterized protein YxjI